MLTSHHECARSHLVRSIAVPALKHAWGFKVLAAWHFNDESGVLDDGACAQLRFLCSIAGALDRTARGTLV